MKREILLAFVCLAWAVTAHADDDLDAVFARDVLIISATAHACYRFDIYLAINRAQTRRGLMHVRNLPPMTGMLFVYESDDYYSMWMKNTYIPLDMVFARSDGTVSSVIRNTEPHSLLSLAAIEPVRYVLELNAGLTAQLSIDAGSRLLWQPMLSNDR